MTPRHPRWDEFINRLSGPTFCNFRGKGDDFKFTCDGSSQRPLARRLLTSMGFSSVEIEQSLGAHGGFCDCEIVLNVKNSFDHMMGRGRPNPKRKRS